MFRSRLSCEYPRQSSTTTTTTTTTTRSRYEPLQRATSATLSRTASEPLSSGREQGNDAAFTTAVPNNVPRNEIRALARLARKDLRPGEVWPRALLLAIPRSPELLPAVRCTLLSDDPSNSDDKQDGLDLLRWLAPRAPNHQVRIEVEMYTKLAQPQPGFPPHWRPWAMSALVTLALLESTQPLVIGDEGARHMLVQLMQQAMQPGALHVHIAESCGFVRHVASAAAAPSTRTPAYEHMALLCIEHLTQPLLVLLHHHEIAACEALLGLLRAQPTAAAATINQLGGVVDVVRALEESVCDELTAGGGTSPAAGWEDYADTALEALQQSLQDGDAAEYGPRAEPGPADRQQSVQGTAQPGLAACLLSILHRLLNREAAGADAAHAASQAAMAAGTVTALVRCLGSGAEAMHCLAVLLDASDDVQREAAEQQLLRCDPMLGQLTNHWRQAPEAAALALWYMHSHLQVTPELQTALVDLLCFTSTEESETSTAYRYRYLLATLLHLLQSGLLQDSLAVQPEAAPALLQALDVAYARVGQLSSNSSGDLTASLLQLWAALSAYPPAAQLMASSPAAVGQSPGQPSCITAALAALQQPPDATAADTGAPDAARPSAHMKLLLNLLRALHQSLQGSPATAQPPNWLQPAHAVMLKTLLQQLGSAYRNSPSTSYEAPDLQALIVCERLARHLLGSSSRDAHDAANRSSDDELNLSLTAMCLSGTSPTDGKGKLAGVGTLDMVAMNLNQLRHVFARHSAERDRVARIMFVQLPNLLLRGELAADAPQPPSISSPLFGASPDALRAEVLDLFRQAAAARERDPAAANGKPTADEPGAAALGCHAGLMQHALMLARQQSPSSGTPTRHQELVNIMSVVDVCVMDELDKIEGCPDRYAGLRSRLGALVPWTMQLMTAAATAAAPKPPSVASKTESTQSSVAAPSAALSALEPAGAMDEDELPEGVAADGVAGRHADARRAAFEILAADRQGAGLLAPSTSVVIAGAMLQSTPADSIKGGVPAAAPTDVLQSATCIFELVSLHLTPLDVLCEVLGCASGDPATITLQRLRERVDQAAPAERTRLSQMALAMELMSRLRHNSHDQADVGPELQATRAEVAVLTAQLRQHQQQESELRAQLASVRQERDDLLTAATSASGDMTESCHCRLKWSDRGRPHWSRVKFELGGIQWGVTLEQRSAAGSQQVVIFLQPTISPGRTIPPPPGTFNLTMVNQANERRSITTEEFTTHSAPPFFYMKVALGAHQVLSEPGWMVNGELLVRVTHHARQ